MAPPTTAAVLDHRCFPHLTDAVLASADRHALLALRATCRSMRDKADARLLHHIAALPTGELVHGDGGRLPAFYPGIVVRRLESGDPRAELTARQKKLLAHTRVLDMADWSSFLLPPIHEAVTNLHALRMDFTGGIHPIVKVPCPVVVLFRDPTRDKLCYKPLEHRGVRKVVCNVKYREMESTEGEGFDLSMPESTSELVIIYRSFRAHRVRDARISDVTNSTMHVIASHTYCNHDACVQYTLVDFPILPELQRAGEGTPLHTQEQAHERFLQLLGETMSQSERSAEMAEAVKARVSFVTLAEYAGRLTPEELYYETTVPPTLGEGL